jgi:predicted porin
MKKSVLALAAMTAVAGAAQAQSSVSVYGIVDVGYKSVTSDSAAITASTSRIVENKVTGISGTGSESTSRFGFRGTEDIGGGLKANFLFETGMDPAGSTLTPMNTRQAYVGIEKDGVGRLDLGTQYTPHHLTMSKFSPSTLPNVPGAVDYTQSVGSIGMGGNLSTFGIVASNPNAVANAAAGITQAAYAAYANNLNNALINAGVGNGTANATLGSAPGVVQTAGTRVVLTATAGANAVTAEDNGLIQVVTEVNRLTAAVSQAALNTRLARGNNTSYTVRNNNVANYQSPTINGFQAGIAYSLPTQTKATGAIAAGFTEESTASILMLNAGYAIGNFAAAAAYSSGTTTTVTNTAAVGASLSIMVPNGLTTLTGALTDVRPTATTADITRQATAASVATVEVKTTETMGAVSYDFGPAKVSYIYTKRAAKDTVSDLSDKVAHNVGVKAPFGATTAFASYTVGNQTILGSTVNQNKFDLRGIQAGVSYALSKRTDAYAIYGSMLQDNKATTIDLKDTGYALGVRHTF